MHRETGLGSSCGDAHGWGAFALLGHDPRTRNSRSAYDVKSDTWHEIGEYQMGMAESSVNVAAALPTRTTAVPKLSSDSTSIETLDDGAPQLRRRAPAQLTSYRWNNIMTNSDADRLSVKSRHRVKTYGEVFTPRSMVDQMLNLVSDDLERGESFVDKTFLEPAAGDGNFLVAILQRKLAAIEERFDSSIWSRESLFSLASIYGIELLEDNHRDAQGALVNEFVTFHEWHGTRCGPRTDLFRAAVFIVEMNIVRGDTLTGRTPRGHEIEFSWWTRQVDDPVKVVREPFTFNSLREPGAFDFAVYDRFAPCPIHHVYKKASADA